MTSNMCGDTGGRKSQHFGAAPGLLRLSRERHGVVLSLHSFANACLLMRCLGGTFHHPVVAPARGLR